MLFVNVQNQGPAENFESLLEWLHPDLDRAAKKYLGIRQSLIKIFTWQGGVDAESLADETLDRVMSRISELRDTYKGDPSIYVYGVARYVLKEQRRAQVKSVELADSVPENQTTDIDNERINDCMERCLASLSPSNRALLLDHYSRDRTEKLSTRNELAERLHIDPRQLRVQMFRIRNTLSTCIEACMKQEDKS